MLLGHAGSVGRRSAADDYRRLQSVMHCRLAVNRVHPIWSAQLVAKERRMVNALRADRDYGLRRRSVSR